MVITAGVYNNSDYDGKPGLVHVDNGWHLQDADAGITTVLELTP